MDFMKKVLAPAAAAFLAVLFYPLCVGEGGCDYLKLWMIVGIPFGVHRMYFWLMPKGFDVGGTAGLFALNLVAGGIIGGFVLAWRLLCAAGYLLLAVWKCLAAVLGKGVRVG